MRTRFHSPAFFNYPDVTSFHLLPLPPSAPPPPPPTFSITETLLCSLGGVDAPPFADLAIPALPIRSAHARFYSDVVPQFVDHPPTTPLTDQASMAGEVMEMNNPRVFERESRIEQKTSVNFDERKLEVVQFEVPQPAALTANANIFKELLHGLPEASEIDTLVIEAKCELQIPILSKKSVYTVDNIQFDYHPPEESCSPEYDGYLPNCFSRCAFPHFEVDDMIFEAAFEPAFENDLVTLFRCTELEYQNQVDHIASDVKELLPSTDPSLVDNIEIEHENYDMEGIDLDLEKDFVRVKESYSWQETANSLGKLNSYYYISADPVFSQEIQFLEINSALNTDIFLEYTEAHEPLNLGSLMKENLGLSSFDELIVSYELVLKDYMFRSLPVPIISESEATILMHDGIRKVLAELKPQPLSVSSDIYLDWHLLEDHKLNNDTSGVCAKLLKDLNHDHTELESSLCDKDMSILTLISEDAAIGSVNEECKVSLNLVSGSCSTSLGTVPVVDVVNPLPRIPISPKGGVKQSKYADMETILIKSVPQFNDLEFFLNPEEATFGTKRISRVEQLDPDDCILLDTTPVKRFHHWDVRIHPVPLSDSIITLISYFQKCYLAILESITLLQRNPLFPCGDKSKLLKFTTQELVNEIGGLIALSSGNRDENILALLTLCAIKRMSWYLCFYGIHATQSYVHNLCSAVDFLRLRLCFLQSLISDALIQTDEDITRSHPSLGKISEILSSKPSNSESKILIVVEQILWCPLKVLLTSIGLSVKEMQNYQWPSHHQDPRGTSASSTALTDILLNADCLIVSHKSISGMFPFHKFALILEYGGSHASSRLTCLPQTSNGLPPLNFLKMELEPLEMLKVFCENSELPFSLGDALEGHATFLLQTHGSLNLQKLEEVLNFVPDSEETTLTPYKAKVAEAHTMSSPISSGERGTRNCIIPLQSHHLPQKNIVTQNHPGLSSCPEQLVVMNTQNLNKEMIVSRRSTYQQLLSLEKHRVQIVERDSSLPADIILTASICLVWYESRNLLNIVNQTEASSCLPFCIEHIAENVLMQLSFAFTSCYLVFEGNHSFTSSVSEYADGFYAAATSLGIDIQLLYSHSSESTGEIILNCIKSATRFTRNLYPPMPESETFAECFLTRFPSINPLSAHAIICSGTSLYEFFRMPLEVRLQVLKKFCVPQVSISLLSVLCKFGEREDSKSGTTDCSSSVSSAPESEYIHCKLWQGGTKRKYSSSPSKDGIILDNSFRYVPSNTSPDAGLNPPRAAAQLLSRISVDPNESTNFTKLSSCLDHKFFGSQGEGIFISGEDIRADTFKSPYTAETSIGEADFEPAAYLGKDFYPFDKSGTHSPLYGKRKAPKPINPGLARKLSFDAIGKPTFPVASKVKFDLGTEKNNGDYEYGGVETNDTYNFRSNGTPSKVGHDDPERQHEPKRFYPPTYQEADDISHYGGKEKNDWDYGYEGAETNDTYNFRSNGTPSKVGHEDPERQHEPNAKRFHPPTYQEADDISHYGGTPLKNAIDTFKLQQGSPWTIEFLNRVREKSRARQKSLSFGTFPSNFGRRGNKPHAEKRKSPSIIDFYRYQGGCSAQKTIKRKTWPQEKEPLSSLEREDASASRTPHDKRARKALSFTMSKHGSQSKLVWLDGSV